MYTISKEFHSIGINDLYQQLEIFHKFESTYLKMDIEGAEKSALKGATETLKIGKHNRLAVCVYHRDEDPAYISGLMQSFGYKTEFTNGYIYWANRLSKGVVRCAN